MIVKVDVRKGTYRDSITLMKISNMVTGLKEVSQAAVVMATPLNKQFLIDLGFRTDEVERAGPNDLVIAIQAKSEKSIESATLEVEKLLSARITEEGEEIPLKTLDSALRLMPDTNLVMISIPGEFAKRQALMALRKGLNVFLFSSNVPIEAELELKKIAKEKHLLMMGPDCGTAIINGIILGFGNVVNEGPVGIVSASGTGLQQVSTIIHREGLGISQAIGTGGNDLSGKVGGIMMIEGIKLLEQDKSTKAIVLISKPPDRKTSERVLEVASRCPKKVVVNFLGSQFDAMAKGYVSAVTLEDAAKMACALIRGQKPEKTVFTDSRNRVISMANSESSQFSSAQKYIRGLFSGGSLCSEALLVLSPLIGDAFSNVPLKPKYTVKDLDKSKEHTCIDMGSEEFTVGRPHPMIDFTLRKRRIAQEARDAETAVILLDVVLGYGSHPDPVAELVPTIASAKTLAEQNARYLSFVASVVGTPDDPQNLTKQEEKLRKAGVIVMPSNAQAARMAALIVARGTMEEKLFGQ